MKKLAVGIVALVSFKLSAMDMGMPDEPEYYVSPEQAYEEVLEWEEETGVKIDHNLKICVGEDCQVFFHKEEGNYNYGTIWLDKKGVKNKKTGNKTTSLKPVLTAIGKGVAAGARVKIKGLRAKADGSFEIDELEMWAGAGVGADVPVPGEEDGKQVHKK